MENIKQIYNSKNIGYRCEITKHKDKSGEIYHACSMCESILNIIPSQFKWNYCPYCGSYIKYVKEE